MKNINNKIILLLIIFTFLIPSTFALLDGGGTSIGDAKGFYNYQNSITPLAHGGYDSSLDGTWNLNTVPILYDIKFGSNSFSPIFKGDNGSISHLIITNNNIMRLYYFNTTLGNFVQSDSVSFAGETLLTNSEIVYNNSEKPRIVLSSYTSYYVYGVNKENNFYKIFNRSIEGQTITTSHGVLGVTCNFDICVSAFHTGVNTAVAVYNSTSNILKIIDVDASEFFPINNTIPIVTDLDNDGVLEVILIVNELSVNTKPDILILTNITLSTFVQRFTKFSSDGILRDVSDTPQITSPMVLQYDGGGDFEIYIAVRNNRITPIQDQTYLFKVIDSTGSTIDTFDNFFICGTFLDTTKVIYFQPSVASFSSINSEICGACSVNNSGTIHVKCFNKRTGIVLSSRTIPVSNSSYPLNFGWEFQPKPNILTANFRKASPTDINLGNEIFIYGYILDENLLDIQSSLGNTFEYQASIGDFNINYEEDIYIAVNRNSVGINVYSTDNINFPPIKNSFTVNPVNPICINTSSNYILTWTEANNHQTKYRYTCDTQNIGFNNFTSLSLDYQANIWCEYNNSGLFDITYNVQDEFNLSMNYSFTVNVKNGVFPTCNVFCSSCDSTETFLETEEKERETVEGESPELGVYIPLALEIMGIRTPASRTFFFVVIAFALIFGIGWGHETFGHYTGALIIIAQLIWIIYSSMPVVNGGLALIPAWIPILLVPVIGIMGLFYYTKFFDRFNQNKG